MKSRIFPGIITILILLNSWSWASSPAAYKIDTERSKIEIKVFRGGFLKMIGHDHSIAAKKFSGVVRFNPADIANSSVDLRIESRSLFVLDDPGVSEKDRKEVQANMEGVKVLNVQEFPSILYHSTEVSDAAKTGENFTLKGRLNLHGVEKGIAFPIHIHLEKNSLHVTGTAAIAQTDFGIKPITGGAGTVRVKDQVHVIFDIFAGRAD
jgi:polyisoprenoid-binding protein YceI